jgi:hypothetical protein
MSQQPSTQAAYRVPTQRMAFYGIILSLLGMPYFGIICAIIAFKRKPENPSSSVTVLLSLLLSGVLLMVVFIVLLLGWGESGHFPW